jgi:release factor glutamine methyltransferase
MTARMTAEASKDEDWTIERVVRWATDDFKGRGIESPRLDAEVLLAHALGTTRVQLVIDGKRPLRKDELTRFKEFVRRRRTHEPVAYVRGEREFYGHAFRVDKRALIPRPDTEILVQVGLERTAHLSMGLRALDVCTGTGCVAIAMALERPTSLAFATDLSPDAVALARDNAHRLGAYGLAIAEGDLFGAVARFRDPWSDDDDRSPLRFDLVTANPPYIPRDEIATLAADVRDFEPRLALDGGADGLDLLRRVIREAPEHLSPGGVLAVEVGAGEAPLVRDLFEARGFLAVAVARDYARIERVVSGVWDAAARG